MPLTSPWDAKSPKKRIKIINILYDGTKRGHLEFSIAELEVSNGKGGVKSVKAIRHDRSYWSANPDNGYPTVRGGRASWFILPDDFQFIVPGNIQNIQEESTGPEDNQLIQNKELS